MKKLIILLLIFFILAFAGSVWFISGLMPVSSSKTQKRFIIDQGETATQIGMDLQKNGLIKNALAFRIYSQVSQAAIRIKPGSYDLPGNLWLPQMITKLLQGPTEVWVTIPEGFRREEIAQKFVTSLDLNAKEGSAFNDEFLQLTANKEGYLFPDTYLVPKDSTPKEVVKMLDDNFKKRVNFPVDSNTIILASILERETKGEDERPTVAGILLKRLSAGWPLQADATIQYAVGVSGNYWPQVTPTDLKVASPYNTYTNTGLPPTPICNPGLSSINAARSPVISNYWYYLHDQNGQIHYAATIEEQNANISKYLQ